MKVYLLWYDNGESYGDSHQDVIGVYSSKDDADEAAAKYNNRQFTCMTEEQFLVSDENDGFQSYQEYVEYAKEEWRWDHSSQCVVEMELIN